MKSCPCRYCEERTMFCHSNCVDYIDWKKDYEKAKAGYVKERKRIQDVNFVLYNKQRKQI